jgi:hypothetical protein
MPAYYNFRCTACGYVEHRYRNLRRCRRCSGLVTRLPDPASCLQAAAPDLLAALEAVLPWAIVSDGYGLYTDRDAVLNMAYDALKKAKGEGV